MPCNLLIAVWREAPFLDAFPHDGILSSEPLKAKESRFFRLSFAISRFPLQKHPQTRMNTGFTGVCTLSLQVDLDAVFKHLLIFCDSIYIVFIHKFCLNFFKIN